MTHGSISGMLQLQKPFPVVRSTLLLLVVSAFSTTSQPTVVDSTRYVILIERIVDGTAGLDNTSSSVEDDECAIDAWDRPKCMCSVDRQPTTTANSSACVPPKTASYTSRLGACGRILASLNYHVDLVSYNLTAENETWGGVEPLDDSSLTEKLKKLKNRLGDFSSVLDRTIVGVYLESMDQREKCLCAYQQWLCTTMLPLYELHNTTTEDQGSCAENVTRTGSGVRIRVRPCLDVCHRVLQQCPYYNPSKFQPMPMDHRECSEPDCNDSARTMRMEPSEIIYGGYPAFDCPREDLLDKQVADDVTAVSYSRCDDSCIHYGGGAVGITAPTAASLFLSAIICVGLNFV